jgi:hypothetical protein
MEEFLVSGELSSLKPLTKEFRNSYPNRTLNHSSVSAENSSLAYR